MGLIEALVVFALTTTITGVMQILIPVRDRLKENYKDNVVCKHFFASVLAFSVVAFILSPFLVFVLCSKDLSKTFKESMYEGMIEEEDENN